MKTPVKFGKYYLLERINVGGMAEVFKAKSFGEAGFERLVAVKSILPSVAEDQEFIAMFVDEAKLAVQLTHPNIAQIFELGRVNDGYFIALEYVPGRDLRAVFERANKRGEKCPVPLACYAIMKLCEGLDYAHNKKDAAGRNLDLVHRDVSPQNILLSWDGDVKLIDFGIAKAASKSSRTQAGILKGKFGYMSPEQVRGLGVDRRSDVFAAGIVLYELLTGERLFSGPDDFSILERVRNCDIPSPSSVHQEVPDELAQIVLKALAKSPEERHRTAMDLHDELQSFMYTSGHFFARKDLGAFMHRVFRDEIAKEAARDEEHRKFDSRRASDLDVFEGAQAPNAMSTNGRNIPPPPPGPPKVSVPPPPPPRVGRSTMVGGMTAPVVPPPPSGFQLSKTMQGPGPIAPPAPQAARPAAPAPPAAMAPASPGLDMDWDDEELATQVYDKIDVIAPPSRAPSAQTMQGLPGPASIPPVARTSGPIAPPPGFSIPPPSAPAGAGYAPPRAPTQPLPTIGAVPRALPAIPAPPPSAVPSQPAPAYGPPIVSAPPPAIGAPPVPAGFGAPQQPLNPFVPPAAEPRGGPPSPPLASAPAQGDRRLPAPFILAGVGGVALVAGLGLIFALTRPKVGTLEVTTNVPDVQLEINGRVTSGTGQHFTIENLDARTPHHLVARRQGYLPRELEVRVGSGDVTPVQVALQPEQVNVAQNAPSQVPIQQIPVQQIPVQQIPVQQVAMQTIPVQQVPVQQIPVQQVPVQQIPVQQVVMQPAQTQATAPVVASAPSQAPRRRTTPRSSEPTVTPRITSSSSSSNANSGGGGGGSGFLSISTRPASRCSVAGQTFSTPRLRLSLPAGTHRISCTNGDFNVSSSFSVTIRAGQETREINHPLN